MIYVIETNSYIRLLESECALKEACKNVLNEMIRGDVVFFKVSKIDNNNIEGNK